MVLREVRGLSLLLSSLNGFIADYGIHTSSLSFASGLIRRLQLARKKGSWRETMMDLGYTEVTDAAKGHALNCRGDEYAFRARSLTRRRPCVGSCGAGFGGLDSPRSTCGNGRDCCLAASDLSRQFHKPVNCDECFLVLVADPAAESVVATRLEQTLAESIFYCRRLDILAFP
jgi:hypothetical protein